MQHAHRMLCSVPSQPVSCFALLLLTSFASILVPVLRRAVNQPIKVVRFAGGQCCT